MKSLLFVSCYFLRLFVSIGGVSQSCPAVCTMCQMGQFICNNGGLLRLPPRLPTATVKIILTKHRFQDTILRAANMSVYGSNHKIKKFFLRDCGITGIEPNAFDTFKHLEMLDLSENRLTVLQPDTFRGVVLISLILDKNIGLQIHQNSFRGLEVSTLSIRNCKFKRLDFESLRSVAARLRTLNAGNNSLTTLDTKLEPLFRNLKSVNLAGNPFLCNCNLLWLSRVYTWKSVYGETSGFDNSHGYPTCYNPPALRHRKMHSVAEEDFHCAAPQLKSIDVQFHSDDSGTLQCSAKGSPKMRVQWLYLTQLDRYVSPPDKQVSSNSIIPFRRENVDNQHFSCVANDTNGKSQADVWIRWPKRPPVLPHRPPISVPLDRNTLPSDDQSQGYEERPSNDQTRRKNEQVSTVRPDSSGYLFTKQFTLLEMIGAVVGTFTITLAIFLVVYRCFMSAHRSRRKKPTYNSTYEATAYSDCHTYDMPHHHTPYLPPPPPPPPLNSGQFLDFKTQQKLYNQV